jgi:surface protein
MDYMFQYCPLLTDLNLSSFDMSKTTNVYNMFYSCSKLTNLDAPKNISASISFSSCTKLTHDSLMSIINNLATVTSSKTLTLGATNLAKLSEEEKAIATNKGWTLQ